MCGLVHAHWIDLRTKNDHIIQNHIESASINSTGSLEVGGGMGERTGVAIGDNDTLPDCAVREKRALKEGEFANALGSCDVM